MSLTILGTGMEGQGRKEIEVAQSQASSWGQRLKGGKGDFSNTKLQPGVLQSTENKYLRSACISSRPLMKMVKVGSGIPVSPFFG